MSTVGLFTIVTGTEKSPRLTLILVSSEASLHSIFFTSLLPLLFFEMHRSSGSSIQGPNEVFYLWCY